MQLVTPLCKGTSKRLRRHLTPRARPLRLRGARKLRLLLLLLLLLVMRKLLGKRMQLMLHLLLLRQLRLRSHLSQKRNTSLIRARLRARRPCKRGPPR